MQSTPAFLDPHYSWNGYDNRSHLLVEDVKDVANTSCGANITGMYWFGFDPLAYPPDVNVKAIIGDFL